MKRAIADVTKDLQPQLKTTMQVHKPDDDFGELSMIMAFLRAVRRQQWWRA